ncbi:MAG: ATP synthase F1 subunit epsilon [bacterium]|nr:ATP synthase F1 subunit epsilon [bacterium]
MAEATVAKKLTLKVITPEKIVFETPAREVILPTTDGMVGILADHVPYLAPLKAGELQAKLEAGDKPDKFISLALDFGVAEFNNNQLTILVGSAARAEEIDLDLAEKARERAQALLKEELKDSEEYTHALAMIEREAAKIKVAAKYRRRFKV